MSNVVKGMGNHPVTGQFVKTDDQEVAEQTGSVFSRAVEGVREVARSLCGDRVAGSDASEKPDDKNTGSRDVKRKLKVSGGLRIVAARSTNGQTYKPLNSNRGDTEWCRVKAPTRKFEWMSEAGGILGLTVNPMNKASNSKKSSEKITPVTFAESQPPFHKYLHIADGADGDGVDEDMAWDSMISSHVFHGELSYV